MLLYCLIFAVGFAAGYALRARRKFAVGDLVVNFRADTTEMENGIRQAEESLSRILVGERGPELFRHKH
jgi:hypothetical protein